MKRKFTFVELIRVIYPPVLYLTIMSVVLLGFEYLLVANNPTVVSDSNRFNEIINSKTLETNLVSVMCSIPVFSALMYYDVQRDKSRNEYIKWQTQKAWKYLLIIPLAFFSMVFGNDLVLVLESFMSQNMLDDYARVEKIIYGSSFIVVLLSSGVLGPIVEELVFRGLVYKRLRKCFGFFSSAIASAIIFGFFHLNMVQFVYAFIMGIIMAFVFENYGIIGSSIMHMTANTIGVVVSFHNGLESNTATEFSSEVIISALYGACVFGIFTVLFIIVINAVCAKDNNSKMIA
ncbi:MAG: CPBP family intramembrane metalloprotease [Lachnospiraceae bacterium]|nr:CPBP family intramembrane metalloprotease [Lachnospiraceae bacterium]